MNCIECGHANSDAASFCERCGAVLGAGAGEHRKVVSVVFCDVVGSTALGESTDPEAVRAILARYFEVMKGIVERFGGSVEKFIGDAVVAVFGVPAVHEDDALRACRAAVAMRESFAELGIEGRIGICTGEVVTGTEERLATGDALNVAARLQQAAQPGEVLIAGSTRAQAGGAVDVASSEPLVLRGKREPVVAFRLLEARAAPERRHDMRFVGRESELALLRRAWARAQAEQRCQLVTIIGEPGLGKSRLTAEALASLDARGVSGRCLPYGVGVTYWPVIEVVKQLGVTPSDPAAAAVIRSLLGETDRGSSAEEIAWAFRKLLEEQAPLVVVLDDIQWGEETFLDLVEYVSLLSSGVPLLLLCMARPELLDRRPSWQPTLQLEPLSGEEATRLIGVVVPEEVRERIATAAAGNPLFIGEMLAVAGEGGADVAIPSSLQSLIAARLDLLDPAERRILERAAVEGEVFHRGAVQALAPEEPQATSRLAALVRRHLIQPDTALFARDDGFRFRHVLIRDIAYESLPKATRAELHERFANWVKKRGRLVELDEILGYHLEQAARYASELGHPDLGLAERAAGRLAAAGYGAAWRGDYRAAERLLERALELTRPARLDVVLELALALAVSTRDDPAAVAIAEAAADRAQAVGDDGDRLLAQFGLLYQRAVVGTDAALDELEQLARKALPLLKEAENDAGLAYIWFVLGSWVANGRGRYEDYEHAVEQTLHHARLAGLPGMGHVGEALVHGPRPADEALHALDALLPDSPHPWPHLCRAWLLTMLGRYDEAAPILREQGERFRELTGDATVDFGLGAIAATRGDHEAAAVHLRRHCDLLEARGERNYLSDKAPMLGRSLCMLGRHDEAEPLAQRGRELAAQHDAAAQTLWRQVQALVDAHYGRHNRAEQLAREAVAIAETTDAPNWQGDALYDLAEVLHAASRTDESIASYRHALECYESKHNFAQADQVRNRLVELQAVTRATPHS